MFNLKILNTFLSYVFSSFVIDVIYYNTYIFIHVVIPLLIEMVIKRVSHLYICIWTVHIYELNILYIPAISRCIIHSAPHHTISSTKISALDWIEDLQIIVIKIYMDTYNNYNYFITLTFYKMQISIFILFENDLIKNIGEFLYQ